MYRTVQKKSHWTARVNECSVRKDAGGDLNVALLGGAENGEFAYVGQVNEGLVAYESGSLSEGELLLEVEMLSIAGLPLYDVNTLIKNSKGPVRLKTVRQGKEEVRAARQNFIQTSDVTESGFTCSRGAWKCSVVHPDQK